MEKKYIWLILGIIIILGIILVFRGFNGGEDNWIKDNKGLWIKHGNPKNTPEKVKIQQDALNCANSLYNNAKNTGMEFNSQCLGTCKDYSIDIVHVPKNSEDNLAENQCSDFRDRITKYFIELDKDGNVVRVVD
ncbi:MAG: hypothetical protein Q8N99_07915 [Nanoarchaeota archaeon]|nr:hypothetical protein [Nanoarchaeota archaeon]